MEYEVGDIVLCTVDKIVGTTVFVALEDKREGSIVISEIAPGRIRNLREYVVPKKKIVCKILRISSNNLELSLRRVTQKEKQEKLEAIKQEKSYKSVLRNILGDASEKAIKVIEQQNTLYDFLKKAKVNPKILEKLVGEKNTKKIF